MSVEEPVSLTADRLPSVLDTGTAHPARRYNYWLGGKDHFAADRASGDDIEMVFPTVRLAALENRAFMQRAVTFLAREAGVRQFLDIGTGIPAPGNTHEVAQAIAPDAKVVYVDNDPVVTVHARALLTGSPTGATAFVQADLRNFREILPNSAVGDTLDLSRPVAVLLVAVLHFLGPQDDPYGIVADLVAALPAGSYLVISHATADFAPPNVLVTCSPPGMYLRSKVEIEEFFRGLEIVDPGVVPTVNWRTTGEPRLTAREAGVYAAVARVP